MISFQRKIRFMLIRIVRQKQSAHHISLGFILGFFPCWLPTFGIGPLLSVSLAKCVHGNLPSAIVAASIGSFLWPILFYFNYQVGKIFHLFLNQSSFFQTQTPQLFSSNAELISSATYFSKWSQIGFDFLLGFAINSLLFSVVGYVGIKFFIQRYHKSILRILRS